MFIFSICISYQVNLLMMILFIKLMRINLSKKPSPKGDVNALWRSSPCSHNYLLANTSTDRARRFEFGSIYYKDQVDKPKKVFN